MTLLLDAPTESLGAQLPRIWSVPPAVSSTGEEAIELAAMAGLELDPWQQFVLAQSLGERADGKWAAFEVGLVVSRQNGKGGLLEARELAGLFLLGERLIIHSAHQFDTSLEAFERLLALIESTPELSRRVRARGVSRSHGTEGIALKSGQRIRFRTRTKGGGRGFTCDCLILDEAMIIPDAMHSALLPTLSARPNPQVWYTGSAVDQETHEHGVVLARVRERGLRGDDQSLAYFEWSAVDDIKEVTPEVANSPESWALANPALGIRISTEYVGNERRSFATNVRGFAVERLGVGDWPSTDGENALISNETWLACADPRSQPEKPLCFAFDVTPDRSVSTISVCGKRKDGLFHIEIVEQASGTWWVIDRLAELVKKHRGVVFCDSTGPAGAMESDLAAHRVKTRPLKSSEYAQACGMFYDGIVDTQSIRHLDTPELAGAIQGAKTKPLADAWKWDRKNSGVDISPLVACTLAYWGCKTQKSRPKVINPADILARAAEREANPVAAPVAPQMSGRSKWTVS